MRLVAVIPATDRPRTLRLCVTAIQDADEPPEDVVVVRTAAHPGPAAARNEGARQAVSADVLVFVDADVIVHRDAFYRIRAQLQGNSGPVAVFGAYDDAPAARDLVSSFRNLLHHHVHHRGAGDITTFWAGLGAVRRHAFMAAGGFDQRRFPRPSIEDVELGARLTAVGAHIVLDPTIQGKHLKTWTLGNMVRTDLFRRGVPWVMLLMRQRRLPPALLNLGWRHRLSAFICVAGLIASLSGRLAAALVLGAGFLALNCSFYVLLLRRGGLRLALAGIPLHVVHYLTCIAAVPIGAAFCLWEERGFQRHRRDRLPTHERYWFAYQEGQSVEDRVARK
jgi:glycosyltransferase involved in cell wall biosynthesis